MPKLNLIIRKHWTNPNQGDSRGKKLCTIKKFKYSKRQREPTSYSILNESKDMKILHQKKVLAKKNIVEKLVKF